ncbi:MAG TPA: hypothetical protein VMM58_12885 [Bacteroidota bacterium]|nr:hypothetical protein [Bacteroidota bacterium]
MIPRESARTKFLKGRLDEGFNEDRVARLAHSLVRYACDIHGLKKEINVAIGYDGRKESARFASIAAEIVSNSGLSVMLSSGVVPTPALSAFVRQQRCDFGIMLTGGYGPPPQIGLEFKDSSGAPFSLRQVEKLFSIYSSREAHPLDVLPRRDIVQLDFLPDYQSYLQNHLSSGAFESFARDPKNSANILIDSMGGAGQTIIEDFLVTKGWRAQTLFGTPEPQFFDRIPQPIPENLQALKYNVSVVNAQIGIATDGDARTCGLLFGNGEWIDSQNVAVALLWHLLEQKGKQGPVIVSSQGTERVELLCKKRGIPAIDAESIKGVHDVKNEGWILAVVNGEGLCLGPDSAECDGILASLLFVEMIAMAGKPGRELMSDILREIGF